MRLVRDFVLSTSGIFLVVVIWQIVGHIHQNPALPTPGRVLVTLYGLIRDGTLNRHITASINIIFRGIIIATFTGFAMGLLIFQYAPLRAAALPVIESIRGVAALTLFPCR